ncbi:MAG: homoserine kinase [Thermoleophilia bacterium]|nr:homoserine kinase [Thermoleophilia bacterium]
MTAKLPFTVSAPASSGNLGPGFDVLAMALSLRNTVQVRQGTGLVDVRGEGAGSLPTDATNLVARAFEQAAGTTIAAAGIDLRCTNTIPPARGLGSSTAAAACGLVAGWEYLEQEWDEDELFAALAVFDGHPDNAAACAHGGIVLCHDRPPVGDFPAELDVIPLGAADWIVPVAVIPDRELSTEQSRGVLPGSYSRHEVVQAIGAAGLLVGGLLGGAPELVESALETDVVHEPHRAALVPELAEARDAAHAGTEALGTTLSGAGPTVLVWSEQDGADQVVGAMAIEFPQATVLPLTIDPHGARLES